MEDLSPVAVAVCGSQASGHVPAIDQLSLLLAKVNLLS